MRSIAATNSSRAGADQVSGTASSELQSLPLTPWEKAEAGMKTKSPMGTGVCAQAGTPARPEG